VQVEGTGAIDFTNIDRSGATDISLDLAGGKSVWKKAPPFATVANSAAKAARMTLKGDMALDPASYDSFAQNVRVTVDGGTVDLCGGTLTVERVEFRNGGKFANGTVNQTNPAKGFVIIFN